MLSREWCGKSTLIKIITGVHCQTKGKMFVNGEEVIFNSPMDAFAAGINVVHQERNLFPTFTVAENIMIEHYSNKLIGKVDQNVINKEAQKYIDLVGLDVPLQRM